MVFFFILAVVLNLTFRFSTLFRGLTTWALPSAHSAVGLPRMERVATRAIHDATSCQQTGKFDSAPFVELVSSVRKLAIQLRWETQNAQTRTAKEIAWLIPQLFDQRYNRFTPSISAYTDAITMSALTPLAVIVSSPLLIFTKTFTSASVPPVMAST